MHVRAMHPKVIQWQLRIEIKYYFVVNEYFEHIIKFDTL